MKSKLLVIAECVGCGTKKEIKALQVKQGEMPMRDKCFSPMITIRIELQEDFLDSLDKEAGG